MSVATSTRCRNRERKKTARAFLTSLAFHLFLILFAAIILAFRPPLSLEEESSPVELTLISPPTPKATPIQAMVTTTESQRSEKVPTNAPFQSDKNTLAATEKAAAGDVPLPTQEGVEIPGMEFENQEYTVGKKARPSSPATPHSPPAPPEEATERKTSQLALLEPPKPTHSPRPKSAPPQPKTPPSPQAAQPPGYQPQTRVTRIRGNISNRGRSAVSAVATPLGRYKKMLSDAIGSRWYFAVNRQMGLLTPGTVELKFIVTSDGKTQKIRVLRNSSNESFAACSVGAVMEAEIPPIPAELIPMLENGRIEIEYSFTILAN